MKEFCSHVSLSGVPWQKWLLATSAAREASVLCRAGHWGPWWLLLCSDTSSLHLLSLFLDISWPLRYADLISDPFCGDILSFISTVLLQIVKWVLESFQGYLGLWIAVYIWDFFLCICGGRGWLKLVSPLPSWWLCYHFLDLSVSIFVNTDIEIHHKFHCLFTKPDLF